jgi:hypothetical protein
MMLIESVESSFLGMQADMRIVLQHSAGQMPSNRLDNMIRLRRGFLQRFEEVVAQLHHGSSGNQFEQALADLGIMIGLAAERRDANGEGPDVLWLLPSKVGIVIEAKSRKKEKNALTKDDHGQLLVAAEWFAANYPGYSVVRVSVHPKNRATKEPLAVPPMHSRMKSWGRWYQIHGLF